MVPAGSHQVSRAWRYSGTAIDRALAFAYGTITPYGAAFQTASTNQCLGNCRSSLQGTDMRPYNTPTATVAALHNEGLGCSHFARRYSGNRDFFLLLRVLRCFTSPAYLYPPYVFRREYLPITTGGFPHSDIRGSTLAQQLPAAFRSRPRPSSASDA